MKKLLVTLALAGSIATTSFAQLSTNGGTFTNAQWMAWLPSLNLNSTGNNNGYVPLPGSLTWNAGATLNLADPDASIANGTPIDIVFFTETATFIKTDLLLQPNLDILIVDAQSPSSPTFGDSGSYAVTQPGFDFRMVVSSGNFNLFANPAQFLWASFSKVIGTTIYKYTILGIEDNLTGGDQDYSDMVIAFGYSEPYTPPTVPEPSTYAAFGALLLAGLIARRRIMAKKA